ncbi:1-deoxy-D-xylulose-5-phosphate reductoisomerase [Basilea psittacipulmonis]|uniref:1-deoxy-D-xylulose 5-phosphate reductoisomerase n=1 Tax=Basilea psittacipulmonis DSM 24701 TaxID=1072685 RepID=A0A077DCM2_9BURK|nr:1-deoxy-D-xylulose-5-phosphate reductoisomerase [Basilea psittacipulmonis]AIL32635.1 1-deoxy-D-xylulose 5-phosphate reductoisomerase [Basilea psittacipulmonis DSM 24701]
MENVVILGATGSIGKNTLNVIASHPDKFKVYALTAHRNTKMLFEQAKVFLPNVLVVGSKDAVQELNTYYESCPELTVPKILVGQEGLCEVAQDSAVDTVVAAIVGIAGLSSVFSAAKAGKKILLANKESLVAAGDLFLKTVQASGATLLPVDSEHNAIFQCLNQNQAKMLRRLILTASGGPFLNTPLAELAQVTPEQACKHPNWSMGRKISVDSATMANKGLEVIEAYYLFGVQREQIEVLIHPQSVVHSMVEYADGSILAQMGYADMRIPISYALAYPDRISSNVPTFNLSQLTELRFSLPDYDKFTCLKLAYDALSLGSAYCNAFNAANEMLVNTFLNKEISYPRIAQGIEAILNDMVAENLPAPQSLDDVYDTDLMVREKTILWIRNAQ